MEIMEVESNTYNDIVHPLIIFDSVRFCELNRSKVKKVHYYIFCEGNKKYFGLIIGEKDDDYGMCPFSAPFGMIEPIKTKWHLEQLMAAIDCLDDLFKFSLNKVKLVIPPVFYYPKLITALINGLIRNGYDIAWQDVNYAFNLNKINSKNYIDNIRSNARKNLTIAMGADLKFYKCLSECDKRKAYDVIKINREEKGYPLRMTWEQVKNTIEFVPHDFFVVKKDEEMIASAIVFHVSPKVAQVIYWGGKMVYSHYKPINYLAYKLIEYYDGKIEYLDIGPSTEYGIPNYGLCDFKDSIGCEMASKFVFEKRVNKR